MRTNLRIPIIGILLMAVTALMGQNDDSNALLLRSGTYPVPANAAAFDWATVNRDMQSDRVYLILQFLKIPSNEQKEAMEAAGVQLFDYLPQKAYWASMEQELSSEQIKNWSIRAFILPERTMKLDPAVARGDFPDHARPDARDVKLWIRFFANANRKSLAAKVGAIARTIDRRLEEYQVWEVRVASSDIDRLAALPEIQFISVVAPDPRPINYEAKGTHRIAPLRSPAGFNLSGQGVVLGEGDGGDPTSHVDVQVNTENRNASGVNNHATHVAGTMVGAGILNPRHEGMAPGASLIAQWFSDIIFNTPAYNQYDGMLLTNNSYTNALGGCPGNGTYDMLSTFVDDQHQSIPEILHVFSAGNDGGATCPPYSPGFFTVKSGWQSAKNTLTVGAVDDFRAVYNFSSKGPVSDGRIKPEVTATGVLLSTRTNNNYGVLGGTSMSAPTVTGGLALLYELYRQKNSGNDPNGGLIKAIVCNTADDRGNTGPDYQYGFGVFNAHRAAKAIDNGTYFSGSVSNGGTNSHSITVPAGTQKLKATLYWVDPEGNPMAANALVNDLDLSVFTPSATFELPWILDPTPGNANNPAVKGFDDINNIEQITIDLPTAGFYTFFVDGFNVPDGPQEYFLAYEFVQPEITVAYPFGGETWAPGETEIIQWEAFDGSTNTFTVEISTDNGMSWTTISSAVPANQHYLSYTVPAVTSTQALVRVSRNGSPISDVSDATFVIGAVPTVSSTNLCEGSTEISWTNTGATDYELLTYDQSASAWQSVITTTGTSHIVHGLSPNETYYFAVQPIFSGTPGRRSAAIIVQPTGGACSNAIFDNNLKAETIAAPTTGRLNTPIALTATESIQLTIKNLDDAASSGTFEVGYTINGGPPVIEMISPSIPALATYTHTFATTADLSVAGTYDIEAWVTHPSDGIMANNQTDQVVKQLTNPPLTLPHIEGFETGSVMAYADGQMGFDGLDEADFEASTDRGRARVINADFPNTGNRAITLDAAPSGSTQNDNDLLLTFNLSAYAASPAVRMNFYYKHHGEYQEGHDLFWIRGSYNDPWVQVGDLVQNQGPIGTFQLWHSINIYEILTLAGQTMSSSFQVRFGQSGFTLAGSGSTYASPAIAIDDGFTFDDIEFYQVTDDVEMVQVISPTPSACDLPNPSTLQVDVKNTMTTTLNNIPIHYKYDGGPTVTESIPSIAGLTTTTYSFANTFNPGGFGWHTVEVWTDLATDSNPLNDTLRLTFYNAPNITTFPYLEGFEASDGDWHTEGDNISWEWGTPAGAVIDKAANGANAWATNLDGDYNGAETSYLVSPCFDLSGLTDPVLSFSHIFELEDNCNCDFGWVEYSTDGINWQKLGTVSMGTNWYDHAGDQWQASRTKWHVASYDLPAVADLRLRFVMDADPFVQFEGFAIDDIHIFDRIPIHPGPNVTGGVNPMVSGTGWVNFLQGGQIFAAINPNGQNLGTTAGRMYIFPSGVRYSVNNQYYLDRNIVLQPTTPPVGNVRVRYFFTDDEANDLINATGCGTCTTINDPYEVGITQYSGANENGNLGDNGAAAYQFVLPGAVSVIPYDNGYYAEYEVNSFSEFWINDGGPLNDTPLPIELLSFSAHKQDAAVRLRWEVGLEEDVLHYEIQVSSNGYSDFAAIGSVAATGQPIYHWLDAPPHRPGARYYRLRIVEADGTITFSPVEVVFFPASEALTVFPNPSSGIFQVTGDIGASAEATLILYDARGQEQLRRNILQTGDSFSETLNLASDRFAPGFYFLKLQQRYSVKSVPLFKVN